jgi:uncharacterized LabA/DUF88 family protein
MEKVCVVIDSSNFYNLVLKKLGSQDVDFDFEKFVKFLAEGREIPNECKRFYVATVRENIEGKNAMSNQTKLFSYLINAGGWKILTSTLRTRTEKIKIDRKVENYESMLNKGIKEIIYTRAREKGIDVKIAIDLIVGAIDKKYDTAILVSSDTDLIPALDLVRFRFNRKVEYIGFSLPKRENCEETKPVPRMIGKTDIQRVLVESDIRNFIRPSLL